VLQDLLFVFDLGVSIRAAVVVEDITSSPCTSSNVQRHTSVLEIPVLNKVTTHTVVLHVYMIILNVYESYVL
jgi:hypothetical protein